MLRLASFSGTGCSICRLLNLEHQVASTNMCSSSLNGGAYPSLSSTSLTLSIPDVSGRLSLVLFFGHSLTKKFSCMKWKMSKYIRRDLEYDSDYEESDDDT